MELDYNDDSKCNTNTNTNDSLDFVSPQKMNYGCENVENDLKYLCGTSAIPNTILNQLQKVNKTTFEEILLSKGNDKGNDIIDIKELCKLQEIISDTYYSSIEIINLSSINTCTKNTEIKYYSTTIPKLDTLINEINGIPSQSITSFIGSPSCGKTLMLYQISSNCLLNNGNVIFIDCNNQFDGQRFYSIIKSVANTLQIDNEKIIENVMKKMDVYSICGIQQMIALFENKQFINKLNKNNIDMIIIDNMGLNTYLYEVNTTFYSHSQIDKLSRKLKYFSIKYNLCVITTSLSVGTFYDNEFWINSVDSNIYRIWYHYIDNEIHLLLMTKFGYIRPILTKSRENVTHKDTSLILRIDQKISESEITQQM